MKRGYLYLLTLTFVIFMLVALCMGAMADSNIQLGPAFTITDKYGTGYQAYGETNIGSVTVGGLYVGGLSRDKTLCDGHLKLESDAFAAAIGPVIKGSYKDKWRFDLLLGAGYSQIDNKATIRCGEHSKSFSDTSGALRLAVRPAIRRMISEQWSVGANANLVQRKNVDTYRVFASYEW